MTNQLKEKLLAYGTKAEPFTVHNHIRVTDLQDGEARVELTLQPESLNRWGTAHGGILFALADIAAGTAVLTLRQEVCLTVNASIDFLDAAGLGSTLIAVGHVDRMGMLPPGQAQGGVEGIFVPGPGRPASQPAAGQRGPLRQRHHRSGRQIGRASCRERV